jgi:Mrp family chromosome partitioning ATPase
VLATRYGKTRRVELEEAAAALKRVDGNLLGVVLNRVPQSAGAARGYGYAYSYEADAGRDTTGVVHPLASTRSDRGRRTDPIDDTGSIATMRSRR